MNRLLSGVVAVLVLLAGAAYLGSPYYALKQLRAAARNADSDRLQQLVDFPQVRAHFKSQLNDQIEAAAGRNPDSALAALGALVAPSLGGRLIDRIVTADSLAAIIRSGKSAHVSIRENGRQEGGDVPPVEQKPQQEPRLSVSARYQGFNHFRVSLKGSQDPDSAAVQLTLTRKGFFAWQVTAIDLPGLADAGTSGKVAQ